MLQHIARHCMTLAEHLLAVLFVQLRLLLPTLNLTTVQATQHGGRQPRYRQRARCSGRPDETVPGRG